MDAKCGVLCARVWFDCCKAWRAVHGCLQYAASQPQSERSVLHIGRHGDVCDAAVSVGSCVACCSLRCAAGQQTRLRMACQQVEVSMKGGVLFAARLYVAQQTQLSGRLAVWCTSRCMCLAVLQRCCSS